ncbi:MAG: hypothetical protein OEW62_01965 [Candidatus Bathyarchaeota archaeon]|nr:hypothetical protein [Candidatus Bathyarchaeota archaeon]
MRHKKFLKLFLALIVAPTILLPWVMICIGKRKDINQLLQPSQPTKREDDTSTFHVVIDEAAEVAPVKQKS